MKKKKILCTHPAVSRLVHVTLDLACVRHQVFHSPVLQCCGVGGGEYGLYTEGDEWKMIKNLICLWQKPQYYYSIFIYLFLIFYRSDSQFVHQVGAQVLSDMLMPGLPHSAGRERGGGGQVRQSTSYRPVWHQLTGDGDETSNRRSEPYL